MAPPPSDPLIDTLAEPLVMLRNMLGQTGDQTAAVGQLRSASTAVDGVQTTTRSALAALNAAWTGPAADSATRKINSVQTAATQIADRGNSIAGIVDQANADMNAARTKLDGIVASFRESALKLGSALHTPPGMSAILDVGRDHLQQARAIISAAEASCNSHAAALAGLTPPNGQVPAPVNVSPAAPHTGDRRPEPDRYRRDETDRNEDTYYDDRNNDDEPRYDPYTGERIHHQDKDPMHQVITDVVKVGAAAVGAGIGEVQHLIDQAQNGQLFGSGNGNANDPFGGLHPGQPANPAAIVPAPGAPPPQAAKPAPPKPATQPKPPAAATPAPASPPWAPAPAPAAPGPAPAAPDAEHHDDGTTAPPAGPPPAPAAPPGPNGQAGVTAALPPMPRNGNQPQPAKPQGQAGVTAPA